MSCTIAKVEVQSNKFEPCRPTLYRCNRDVWDGSINALRSWSVYINQHRSRRIPSRKNVPQYIKYNVWYEDKLIELFSLSQKSWPLRVSGTKSSNFFACAKFLRTIQYLKLNSGHGLLYKYVLEPQVEISGQRMAWNCLPATYARELFCCFLLFLSCFQKMAKFRTSSPVLSHNRRLRPEIQRVKLEQIWVVPPAK